MTDKQQHTAVVALGGNALSPPGERSTIADQFRHTRESLAPIVELAREGWRICVVHGNGPQVGDELVRNQVARADVEPLPLGVLVGATAGWIGYMIQQSLENALRKAGSERAVTTIITQVIVDPDDPALRNPSKFIGHSIPEDRARALLAEGHAVRQDANGMFRRVVGSPTPLGIHDLPIIKPLIENGTIVIACGGGGVPVYVDPEKGLEGLDAIVDKDAAAAVLARGLDAELLMILTNVDGVYADWGKPIQKKLSGLTVAEARALDARGAFGEGSMAPKVRAAADYADATSGRAVIAELKQGMDAVRGRAGTTIAG
ncbi:MAG TPA: carbamate kinase [Gemmatimonadaceae bacterium]|nr:carbamate kinase [Gemmatimonadaceae bacterium]